MVVTILSSCVYVCMQDKSDNVSFGIQPPVWCLKSHVFSRETEIFI